MNWVPLVIWAHREILVYLVMLGRLESLVLLVHPDLMVLLALLELLVSQEIAVCLALLEKMERLAHLVLRDHVDLWVTKESVESLANPVLVDPRVDVVCLDLKDREA